MKKILILILFFVGTDKLIAQNIATTPLIWTVTQLKDLNTNTETSYQCTFSTHGNQTIIWAQKNGTYNTNIEVQAVSGSWNNVATVGSVTYTITMEGDSGTLQFEKTTSGTYITIDLVQPGSKNLRHRYTVSQVNAN